MIPALNLFLESVGELFLLQFALNYEIGFVIYNDSNEHLHNNKNMLNWKHKDGKLEFIPFEEWANTNYRILKVYFFTICI